MPKVQLMLTHAASYALKEEALNADLLSSEDVAIIAIYHGKAIIIVQGVTG